MSERASRYKGWRAVSWKEWGLTCWQYIRNEWCIDYFTTSLKLENQLPVWTEAQKGRTKLNSLTWEYIGRPVWLLEKLGDILEYLSVDTEISDCWWLSTFKGKKRIKFSYNWSWRLNISDYQFEIYE